MENDNSNKMWGSRFSSMPSDLMQEINQSISFDWRLYKQDIAGSIAHSKMLAKQFIISEIESQKIIQGLEEILQEINDGKFNFKIELEDIHMNIENRLKEKIGDVAGKLHTARSRNDQVATDLKLFIREEIDEIILLLHNFLCELIKKSENNLDAIMPGFTHLQIAQPILFSHHLLAYFEMIKRDISRLQDCKTRLNECPLGACAMAGTSYPIDRFFVAKELGFAKPTNNSMDSVSDRDFAIEFLSCLSILSMHFSRFAEEIILWASKGFDFIKLSDAYTSGSSIMPQKKNPDAAELVRGKTGRIYGSLFSLLTMMKSLPLTYSKDMQEDKEQIFDACKNIKIIIQVFIGMLADIVLNKTNMYEFSRNHFSTATDLADWIVKNLKLPFRDAHHITGKIVIFAEENNLELSEIKISDLQKIEKNITNEIHKVLSVDNSVLSKSSFAGTSRKSVEEQILIAKKFLDDGK